MKWVLVFLFGTQAARLGFMVTLVQSEFPDCEAFVEVAPGKLQRLKIEFENESRNFLKHGHDPKGCDLIICWKHNWPECPVEVLELRSVMAQSILEADQESGKRLLTTEAERKTQTFPRIDTDDTAQMDQKTLPRITADKPGSEE